LSIPGAAPALLKNADLKVGHYSKNNVKLDPPAAGVKRAKQKAYIK